MSPKFDRYHSSFLFPHRQTSILILIGSARTAPSPFKHPTLIDIHCSLHLVGQLKIHSEDLTLYLKLLVLEDVRRRLHDQFLIPANKPTFKKVHAYVIPGEETRSTYLTNTHVGLGPSGGNYRRLLLLRCSGIFYHYFYIRNIHNNMKMVTFGWLMLNYEI